MKITSGLFDNMVLQRNKENLSQAEFNGLSAAEGPVAATVRQKGKTLSGFDGLEVGMASGGRMKGSINGLPVGGPYDIELKAAGERLLVRDVLVGDIWLLGGQSNMQGCGRFPERKLSISPFVRAFYMDDRWAVAEDPVHNMWECVDQVHIDLRGGLRMPRPDPDWGVCPGPAFADELHRLTGVPQGIIACAHGGTTMSQWDPGRKREGGKSLYGALIRRLKKNGGHVAGMIWYQGCSDASADAAPLYTRRMKRLLASLRRDCGDSSLPVAMVQISHVVGWEKKNTVHWNSIQEQQRLLGKSMANLVVVPSIDLPLEDSIHISGASQYILGKRLAQAMQILRGQGGAGLPPIELGRIRIEEKHGRGVAAVQFNHVAGRLNAPGRPSGFSIIDDNGPGNQFRIELHGDTVRIYSQLPPGMLKTAMLHYGYGQDPYCNITDDDGRSLPVLGPVRLGYRIVSPFIKEVMVSDFQPSAGKLHQLEYPADRTLLQMHKRSYEGNFLSLHQEIAGRGGRDETVYFAFNFFCAEEMQLKLLLGYDGPVKAWLDGEEICHDPDGTNPGIPSKAQVGLAASAGEHEIMVALGTNNGAAWGIFAQLERTDVKKNLILKGEGHYAMPVFSELL